MQMNPFSKEPGTTSTSLIFEYGISIYPPLWKVVPNIFSLTIETPELRRMIVPFNPLKDFIVILRSIVRFQFH